MNAGNVNLPHTRLLVRRRQPHHTGTRDHRYQGVYAGGESHTAISIPLSEHWNLEAEIGAGYGHVWYDKFQCGHCVGKKLSKGGTNYLGITKNRSVADVYLLTADHTFKRKTQGIR